jgi:radical SAM superfamily enzyme YgiQ (UPF0313 family)
MNHNFILFQNERKKISWHANALPLSVRRGCGRGLCRFPSGTEVNRFPFAPYGSRPARSPPARPKDHSIKSALDISRF